MITRYVDTVILPIQYQLLCWTFPRHKTWHASRSFIYATLSLLSRIFSHWTLLKGFNVKTRRIRRIDWWSDSVTRKRNKTKICFSASRHRLVLTKPENNVDYHVFLKYFQDRSESSFLARSLNNFKTKFSSSEFENVEHGIIDLLHRLFLSLSAAFKFVENVFSSALGRSRKFVHFSDKFRPKLTISVLKKNFSSFSNMN